MGVPVECVYYGILKKGQKFCFFFFRGGHVYYEPTIIVDLINGISPAEDLDP